MASRSNGRRSAKRSGASGSSVREMSRSIERPKSVEELFEGNLLQGRFNTEPVYAWFQKRHKSTVKFIDEEGFYRRNGHEWKVPYGVRHCMKVPLVWSQVAQKYPFYVTWVSPKTGKRLRKKFTSLAHAIVFVAERAQYVDRHATIVNRLGIDIPPKLRGKIPKPWKWCPCCMKARKYKRVYNAKGEADTFFGPLKVWHIETNKRGQVLWEGWETRDVKLALMRCGVCELTNRNYKFRRSNQPWEKVKIKKGKTRVKRRKR